jgi:hypothetical protein
MNKIEITFLSLLTLFLGSLTVNIFKVERFCLAHGYPQGAWRIIGPNYCIKRVNQTDVVISTEDLK